MNFGSLDLNSVWFVLIGVLFTGYAMLDGFDLGVGALHLFAKEDQDRRVLINAIGPVWDGNEVWLVTGGGALFAVFIYLLDHKIQHGPDDADLLPAGKLALPMKPETSNPKSE